jgi:hypothetical protein
LLGLLDEVGYAGWVGCEYRPRDSRGRSAGGCLRRKTGISSGWRRQPRATTPQTQKDPPPARRARPASPMLVCSW